MGLGFWGGVLRFRGGTLRFRIHVTIPSAPMPPAPPDLTRRSQPAGPSAVDAADAACAPPQEGVPEVEPEVEPCDLPEIILSASSNPLSAGLFVDWTKTDRVC